MQRPSVRVASHAGSWYTHVPQTLAEQLNSWLGAAVKTVERAKAVICPHAGYSYSGPTAAWAYKHLNPEGTRRVVLLGPSHHFYLEGCALPFSATYQTPLGDLPIDQAAVSTLRQSQLYQDLTSAAEEEEHSLEMQLPYIRQAYAGKNIALVPVMVGQLQPSQEEAYARSLLPLFEDPETVFVISSDFCVRARIALGNSVQIYSL